MLPMFVQRQANSTLASITTAATALLTLCALTVTTPHAARAQDAPPTPPAQPTTPPAPAQPATPPASDDSDSAKHHFSYGPEVGLYLPTNSKTRSAFGDAWFSLGLGLGEIRRASATGRVQADFGLFGTSHSGGHQLYIAPLGVSYIRALNQSESSTPYVGVSADVILTQIRSDPDGIISRMRGTGGGSIMIGDAFNKKTYIQARYFFMGTIRGYNLSGLNLSTGYRF